MEMVIRQIYWKVLPNVGLNDDEGIRTTFAVSVVSMLDIVVKAIKGNLWAFLMWKIILLFIQSHEDVNTVNFEN